MTVRKLGIFALILLGSYLVLAKGYALEKAPIDRRDVVSLQRGFKWFMNYCSGCHSLKYTRYSELARNLKIVDGTGKVLEEAVKKNLLFVGEKLTDNLQTAVSKEDVVHWFGTVPPDLSLVARSKGVDWVYTFLQSFYPDTSKVWGVNNKVFPDVAMPYVLVNLEKKLSKEEFHQVIVDLTNFLAYVGEPHALERQALGVWVLLFLGVFAVFACLLKREYWKKIH